MNGGSQTTSTYSPYSPALAKYGKAYNAATLPILQQLSGQIQQMLQTGGNTSSVPALNRSTDAARSALANSNSAAENSFAKANMGNSTYAQQQINANNMAGNESIASLGPSFYQTFLGMAPGLATSGTGVSALNSAAGYDNTQTTSANPGFWNTFSSMMGGGMSGLGEGAGMAIGQGGLSSLFGAGADASADGLGELGTMAALGVL